MENHTIALGSLGSVTEINDTFSITILDGRDSMRPIMLRALPELSWTLCGIAWVFLFIGSYFRYILYSHLYRKHRNNQMTSIDVLILVSSISQHVSNIARPIFFSTMLVEGSASEYWDWKMDNTGKLFCVLFRILMAFDYYYSCIGSLGIALFRIIYVQCGAIVQDRIGAVRLMRMILFGGLALTILLVYTLLISEYEQIIIENGNVPANIEILRLLDEYEQGRGGPNILQYFVHPRIINAGIMLLVTLSELTIYVIVFRSIYRHDNNERLRRLLDPSIIKQRNRTNAITFFGTFCSFLFEISIWILHVLVLLAGKNFILLGATISISRTISFTFMTIIEVVTSSSLRPIMYDHIDRLFGMFRYYIFTP